VATDVSGMRGLRALTQVGHTGKDVRHQHGYDPDVLSM
jgi:hypothetical protein